jgi:hypothetical protein
MMCSSAGSALCQTRAATALHTTLHPLLLSSRSPMKMMTARPHHASHSLAAAQHAHVPAAAARRPALVPPRASAASQGASPIPCPCAALCGCMDPACPCVCALQAVGLGLVVTAGNGGDSGSGRARIPSLAQVHCWHTAETQQCYRLAFSASSTGRVQKLSHTFLWRL